MFNVVVPFYEFESYEHGQEVLGNHHWESMRLSLHSLNVDHVEGTLRVNGRYIPMTNLFAKPMLRAVGLPVHNLNCGLSDERIAGDFNELTQKTTADITVLLRTMDGAAYDLQVLSKKNDDDHIRTPLSHQSFVTKLLDGCPHLRYHKIDMFTFDNGVLHLRTRSEDQKLEPIDGDISWSGLEFVNIDHGESPYASLAYHIYRTSCTNSAVGIAEKVWYPDSNSSIIFEDLVNSTNYYLEHQDDLKEGYRRLAHNPLTMYTLKNTWQDLLDSVGKRSSEHLMGEYLRESDEPKWKEPDPSVLEMGKTEYHLFNDITHNCKTLEKSTHRWRAQQVAGNMITKYMELSERLNQNAEEV